MKLYNLLCDCVHREIQMSVHVYAVAVAAPDALDSRKK